VKTRFRGSPKPGNVQLDGKIGANQQSASPVLTAPRWETPTEIDADPFTGAGVTANVTIGN
jgi:hypothetical protein